MRKQTRTDLKTEVQELRLRVEKLESALAAIISKTGEARTSLTAANGPKVAQGVTPEIVVAITAAVAAFLGKRATIHQIRLTGTTAWAMQGRATVQASHGLQRWSR
jgi:methylmalonyl-CoA carboxyltransferase large subunit